MLGVHRVRGGLGEQLTAWIRRELAARDLDPVPLREPLDLPRRPRPHVAVLVLPDRTTLPARRREHLARLCSGLTIAPVHYGRRDAAVAARPLVEALTARGARPCGPSMTLETAAWHAHGGPDAFDRLALHLLLDQLLATVGAPGERHHAEYTE